MKLPLIFLLILFSLKGLTQDKKATIKLAPLSLVDFVSFPTVQGGLEFGLSQKVSWYNEFGLRYGKGGNENADTSFIHSKGLKAKTEVQYYFHHGKEVKKFKRLEGYYMAVNVFYVLDQHNAKTDYYFHSDTAAKRIDNFGVTKTVWGANFLLGKQQSIGKNFLIDLYAGLGVRYRKILTTNKEFDAEQDYLIQAVDVTVAGFKYKAESKGGKSILPNFTLGLRLCYKF